MPTPAVLALLASSALAAPPNFSPRPSAIVDLRTPAGLSLVSGSWKFHDAAFIPADHHLPGPDKKPTGAPVKTLDTSPRADSLPADGWTPIAPDDLETRRGTGKVSAVWYSLSATLPQSVADLNLSGATAVLELVVDDYAEVWVNGQLSQVLGASDGPTIAGWNTPTRVVLTRDGKPGQAFDVKVFAMNGPVSQPPGNYIWIRSATIDLYKPGSYSNAATVPITVERLDPAIDQIIPREPVLEKLAGGFSFAEGPVWIAPSYAGAGYLPATDGYLLFSDPNDNTIYRLTQDGRVSIYRAKSGYTGPDIARLGQPGSNGLTLDSQHRLTLCEHGNRRITRLEPNGTLTVLADKFNGKRLNSPNDLVYRSDGALYFTDPPFGLPGFHDSPLREQPHFGVYCLYNNELKLVSTDLRGPNGLAFSPDENFLYVANWDEQRKVVMRYSVAPSGELSAANVFFDMTQAPGEEALDGLKVDTMGNLYVSGPGGLWIIDKNAKHLGTLKTPELPANFTFGDADGKTLYITARSSIYRLRTNIEGIRPR